MKAIDIKECHTILMALATTVNEICERHGITFYMLGGTMLGAIRHKGFIPWDDDMDFGVLYDRYDELIHILDNELPKYYRILTYERDENSFQFFMKIEDTRTIAYDVCLERVPLERQHGITLDIFPLVRCQEQAFESIIPRVRKKTDIIRSVYVGSTKRQWYKVIAKKIIRRLYPVSTKTINRNIKQIIDTIETGDFVCNVVSPQFWNKHFKWSMFKDIRRYPFENVEFWGVTDFDGYLSMLYKNYMQLPQKEKQRIHLDNVWWR